MEIVLTVLFLAVLCGLAWQDIRAKLISPWLLAVLLALAALQVFMNMLQHDMNLMYLWSGLLTALVCGGVFWLLHRFTKGVGMGDVKLMAVIGLHYGALRIFSIVFLSMLFVAIAGIVLVIKDRGNMKRQLPFAPFVAVAAILCELLTRVAV